ncbi:U-box domain-containing protein 45 [Cryptomeria japonica]|uniref:U-box domain-containing protein 45 n=1 Tax=Cryptomeria japonica TaxID=3369 RepID=UPI0027DA4F18|nr:U-box domain-containing protein 45 [Cryptomeria japonica]XP_057858383.2 U-box domain-containing protein 45 [Cryptomeria japonica]XP_057858384.2 U-box domain-containing protein 45 [Cryptomeria japonica]
MERIEAAVEQIFSTANDAKLHGGMCRQLARLVGKMMKIFPAIEAARPRCKSGIQALCAFHLALEKAKSLLQHCGDCSKFYLAITGDAVLVKFERVKDDLLQGLQRLEVIVPHTLAWQITEIFKELEQAKFALEPTEKEIGDDLITLLQQDKDASGLNDISELEAFHQAATRLGIVSPKTISLEKRSLRKQLDKSRCEDDKRKESIISYLLHLLRKYNKLFRNECMDDVDSQYSDPCSPSVRNSLEEAHVSGRRSDQDDSKIQSFKLVAKETLRSSVGMLPAVPEEFRCPISLQLMSDPVIICSGQTYERVCIEKWFSEGHDTCPKTQQKLSYLSVTPNYCVKGLIGSWCEKNGIRVPEPPPPPSLPLIYWRWDQSDSMKSVADGRLKRVKVGLSEDDQVANFDKGDAVSLSTPTLDHNIFSESAVFPIKGELIQISGTDPSLTYDMVDAQNLEEHSTEKYERLLANLNSSSLEVQCAAAEEVALLCKDDSACSYMGANHFISALVKFLQSSVDVLDTKAQEVGASALLKMTWNNNRNKASILSSGVVPLLLNLLDSKTAEAALAVLLALSSWDDNKATIGSLGAIPCLIKLLRSNSYQCRQDALNTLYHLSINAENQSRMVSADAVSNIVHLLTVCEVDFTEICISILYNLASIEDGRTAIADTDGCIVTIAELLDTGTPKEQEQSVATLLLLCTKSFDHCQLVLREGVIPSLVTLSVTGTPWGRDKAQKLLQHFREQRQRDASWLSPPKTVCNPEESMNRQASSKEKRKLYKSTSKKIGRTLSFFWKAKSFSLYQC